MRPIYYALICVLLFSGCTSIGSKPDFSALKPAGPAAKAVAAWEPAVKHNGDQPAERGFGGRVYFYDAGEHKPVKVKGSVVVYAYDEEGRSVEDNVPTRSFVFDQQDLKRNYSKSKLGHSYNFWIPWDNAGPNGKASKVSLIVRYIPQQGSSVVSSQQALYLPGRVNQDEMSAKAEWEQYQNGGLAAPKGIQQVGWRSPVGGAKAEERLIEGNDNRPQTMQTSTINILKK